MIPKHEFERLVDAAEAVVAITRSDFEQELAASLAELQASWASVRTSEDWPAALPHCRILAHRIRDICSTFGFELMMEVAGSLSHLMQELLPRTASVKAREVIDCHLQALELLQPKQLQGDGGAPGRQLVAGLAEASRVCLAD